MSFRLIPCPKCNRLHGVIAVRASRSGRASSPRSHRVDKDRAQTEAPERVRLRAGTRSRHDGGLTSLAAPVTGRGLQAGKPNRPRGTVEPPASSRQVARALPAGSPSPETPCDGRESSLSDSPLGRSRSRSSQAASPLASRSGGTG